VRGAGTHRSKRSRCGVQPSPPYTTIPEKTAGSPAARRGHFVSSRAASSRAASSRAASSHAASLRAASFVGAESNVRRASRVEIRHSRGAGGSGRAQRPQRGAEAPLRSATPTQRVRLVPKLDLGTPVRETVFRQRGEPRRRNRVSGRRLPKGVGSRRINPKKLKVPSL